MASNQPFNVRIIDSQAAKDVPHSLQATDLVSKVHGPDGAAIVAQGAVKTSSSPLISNARVSNVPHKHVLTHSWAGHVEEGDFIPQAALDLVAAYGGFTVDPSFFKESLHGSSSSPSLRGRRSFNGSHGGHGGRGRGARLARGTHIEDQKLSVNSFDKVSFCELRSAYVSNSNGFSTAPKGNVQDYGRSNAQAALGCDRGSF
ncbi:hypothetical protein F0562_032178 [Nyssa sinensis]|uniref:Uncharacterized protein n=1 Tax=Nyssa sinensis TaxID=561372 RepID=A0A5J5B089_9ASTE|nr:hypothetical protein F0562_032178 [Nyssa sinensis]